MNGNCCGDTHDEDLLPAKLRHVAFPFTIAIEGDEGIHVTLDDFVPKVLVRAFLATIVGKRGPEYDALLEALDA